MIFTWELSDLDSGKKWGLMATNDRETVILCNKSMTSLRDGHHWEYDSKEEMIDDLNKKKYRPILAPINPSRLVRALEKERFNYGDGFIKRGEE